MSKKLLCAIAVALAAGLSSATTWAQENPASEIYWGNDPQVAMDLSRDTQQPILVYATSERCGYCRKMERDTWSNSAIIQQVESGFVPLRLDSKRDARIMARLRVRAYPTTVLISPEGHVISGAAGYQSPDELADLLRKLRVAESATQSVSLPR